MKARLKGKRATGGAIEVLVERMLDTHTHIAISNQVTHLKQAQNCISVKMLFLSRYKVAMKICLW
jgi:S-adenosylmethionine:tRNA-ribosyltransferase-isomerase (queuine synthetase)